MKRKLILLLALVAVVCWLPAQAKADFSYSLIGFSESSGINYGIYSATDVAADTVQLIFDISQNTASYDPTGPASNFKGGSITEVYFNIDPFQSVAFSGLVTLTEEDGTTTTYAPTLSLTENTYKADGDGRYDAFFTTPGGVGSTEFRKVEFILTGTGLTANILNALSDPDGGHGPFFGAVHVQKLGADNEDSEYAGAVPLPGAVLLFGAGMARLVAYARRRQDS